MADVVSFIEIAGKLPVIVRPSPFICAEWEFGGLPGWSLGYGEIRLRCSDPLYLSKVDHYYDELIRDWFALSTRRADSGGSGRE